MVQGFWPLEKTENGTLVLAGNSDGYVSNWFASGSKPRMQGSGIAFLGNYGDTNVDNDFGLAIEYEAAPQLSEKTGEGHYQDGEKGVLIQVTGFLANSSNAEEEWKEHGLDSHYNVDTRPGIEGRAAYTLTYHIPEKGRCWRQDIDIAVTQNQCGALATLVVSNNAAGYEGGDLLYAGTPLLAGKGSADNTKKGI